MGCELAISGPGSRSPRVRRRRWAAAGSHLETFHAWVKRPMSARALWDIVITEIWPATTSPTTRAARGPESLYGSVKMWAHLNRQGIIVAKRTVERLTRIPWLAGGATPQEDPHHRLPSSC